MLVFGAVYKLRRLQVLFSIYTSLMQVHVRLNFLSYKNGQPKHSKFEQHAVRLNIATLYCPGCFLYYYFFNLKK